MVRGEDSSTVKIKLWGIVQGVGFRPFVAKLAHKMQMKGVVSNVGGLVEILITDTWARIETFGAALKVEKPLPAEIVHMSIEKMPLMEFLAFTILDSHEGSKAEAVMIPADLAICQDCIKELKNPQNKRGNHPFISCMVCGPRYTMIDRVPYDRKNTAMVDFPMCRSCEKEYTSGEDRRYHAQTISCHDCGPQLIYQEAEETFHRGEAFERSLLAIKSQKILAVKGIGGYHFACSAFSEEAAANLRKLKIREEKPFAVMFESVEKIKHYCDVSAEEKNLLESNARPIVLLKRKQTPQNGKGITPEVYKTSRFLGAFLPSTPLQVMMLDVCGPMVMTSANLTQQPMIKDDEEMLGLNSEYLSGILYNQREIRTRVDDSVVRVVDGMPQMIRRSKGYTPLPLYLLGSDKEDMVLALGGDLKAAFAMTKGAFAYVSQYFGDLDQDRSIAIYQQTIRQFAKLFAIEPSLAVVDMHPRYASRWVGQQYGCKEILQVQHHHAHIASVMAEHQIEEPIIGVAFDGTGYGSDGAIWGGEIFLCEKNDFIRKAHLEYVNILGGDDAMKNGKKSEMSYRVHYEMEYACENQKENKVYDTIKSAIKHNINTMKSSSMGRLFDGAASILNIHDENRYEGECGIMLENAAADALEQGLKPYEMNFEVTGPGKEESTIFSARPIFEKILQGQREGVSPQEMALGFHYSVATLVAKLCREIGIKEQIKKVALSGGVFQNNILMKKTLELLRAQGFEVYFNISVPTNDGGICLGQAYIGMKYLKERKKRG